MYCISTVSMYNAKIITSQKFPDLQAFKNCFPDKYKRNLYMTNFFEKHVSNKDNYLGL